MGLFRTLRVALRALGKNKMRAALTILGVVIGIAAVTAVVSFGQSASQLVKGEISSFGSNMLIIFPGSEHEGGVHQGAGTRPTLTPEDVDAIGEECPAIQDVSPLTFAAGQLIYANENWSPKELKGVGPGYLGVRTWRLQRGAFFTERDVASAAQVCVIGHTIVKKLFQTMNPIGEMIRIRNVPFEVIGVLEQKGGNIMGEDQDDVVLLPFTSVGQRLYQTRFRNVPVAIASAKSQALMADAVDQIRQLLLERHRIAPGNPADFEIQNTTEIADSLGRVTGILTFFVGIIAFISLIVGGVGIMNIMLVSVTERTREIGTRMAVGARGGDILRQFLVEAIVLSIIGGLIGFSFGVGASVGGITLLNEFTNGPDWPVVVSVPAGILAVIVSAIVGMVFGFFPAWRASKLDPIDALRYE